MDTLKHYLLQKGYTTVKLKRTITNHFEITVKINGTKGRFILDTGASNSCVGFEAVTPFHLKIKDSDIKAVGAGDSNIDTKLSKKNNLKIGRWTQNNTTLVVFNLSHVNTGLIAHNANAVDGIIGADILKKAKAIIDYKSKRLFLKL